MYPNPPIQRVSHIEVTSAAHHISNLLVFVDMLGIEDAALVFKFWQMGGADGDGVSVSIVSLGTERVEMGGGGVGVGVDVEVEDT